MAGKVSCKHCLLSGVPAYGREEDLFVIPEPVRKGLVLALHHIRYRAWDLVLFSLQII